MNIEKIKSSNDNGNIWMFHRVRLNDKYISNIYDKRNMVHNFDSIICLIDKYFKLGYSFGSLSQAINNSKIIHLTFDDGYKEHLIVAKKLKKKYNFSYDCITFSINIRNSFYDDKLSMDIIYELIENDLLYILYDLLKIDNNTSLQDIKKIIFTNPTSEIIIAVNKKVNMKDYYLNKEDLIDLSKLFCIASHCINHSFLTSLSDENIYKELYNSKQFLSKELNIKVNTICFPDGKHSEKINRMSQKIGYKFGLSISSNFKDSKEYNIERSILQCG
jgi:peptidoglycan/xylan/chitin deacetylase (PgdA/CDA1 family)